MDQLQIDFNRVWEIIRKDENFIPRNYQTIGGMWTTDTWKKHGIRALLQDEGYTRALVTETVTAYQTGDHPMMFLRGSKDELREEIEQFNRLEALKIIDVG